MPLLRSIGPDLLQFFQYLGLQLGKSWFKKILEITEARSPKTKGKNQKGKYPAYLTTLEQPIWTPVEVIKTTRKLEDQLKQAAFPISVSTRQPISSSSRSGFDLYINRTEDQYNPWEVTRTDSLTKLSRAQLSYPQFDLQPLVQPETLPIAQQECRKLEEKLTGTPNVRENPVEYQY